IHAGHLQVEENQVVAVLTMQRADLVRISGRAHAAVAGLAQGLLEQADIGLLIVDDQEAGVEDVGLGDHAASFSAANFSATSGALGRASAASAAAGIASRGAALSRNSIQNTLPVPTVLSTPITPPISSTKRLVTTRPMPVPSSAPAALPRRLNGWKSCPSCS